MFERLSELPSVPFEAPGWRLANKPAADIALALAFADGPAPEGADVRDAGPRRWLLIGEAPFAVRDGLQLIDLSHARERLELSGPDAAAKLATGTAVTLTEGASAQTLFGPLAIHLTRTGPQTYEILVARSLALSLWRALTHA